MPTHAPFDHTSSEHSSPHTSNSDIQNHNDKNIHSVCPKDDICPDAPSVSVSGTPSSSQSELTPSVSSSHQACDHAPFTPSNAVSFNTVFRWNALHALSPTLAARAGLAVFGKAHKPGTAHQLHALPNVHLNSVRPPSRSLDALPTPPATPDTPRPYQEPPICNAFRSSSSSPERVPAGPSSYASHRTKGDHISYPHGRHQLQYNPVTSPTPSGYRSAPSASIDIAGSQTDRILSMPVTVPSSPAIAVQSRPSYAAPPASPFLLHHQMPFPAYSAGYPTPASPANGPFDFVEVRALRAKFNELDSQGSGAISREDFHRLFTSLVGIPESISESAKSELLNFVYQLFSGSGSNRLNLREFIAGCIVLGRGTESDRLRYLFQMYDLDRSGSLSLNELERMFYVIQTCATMRGVATGAASLPSVECSVKSAAEITELAEKAMREHDMDNDGKIGFNDFVQWCSAEPYVREWLDWLSADTARGISRLREEREREMILRELSNIGFDDNQFWRESFSLVDAATKSTSGASATLPDSIPESYLREQSNIMQRDLSNDSFDHGNSSNHPLQSAPPSSVTQLSQATVEEDDCARADDPLRKGLLLSPLPARDTENSDVHVLRSASSANSRPSPFEIDFASLELISKIGEGSFATVWKGKWLDTDVAVKILKSGPQLNLVKDCASPSSSKRRLPNSPMGEGSCQESTCDKKETDWDSMDETLEPELASANDPPTMVLNRSRLDGVERDGDGPTMSSRDRSHFLREVGLLTSLRHPNVLLLMGACTDPQYPLCIVSELVQGGSLYSYLHGRQVHRLSNRHAMKLALDIARGMLYLHSSIPIVLHRDLKSSNILIEGMEDEETPKAKIIDFGLSRLDSTKDSRIGGVGGGLCGSLMTMAPEVMRGDTYLPASDVYSFGVILCEMFTGRVPFEDSNVVQLMYGVSMQGKRPKLVESDNVPADVVSLIKACWDQEPSNRPDFGTVVKRLNSAQRAIGGAGSWAKPFHR